MMQCMNTDSVSLLLFAFCVNSTMPTDTHDSDGVVSPPDTCVDTVTVHLHSQCSGDCSDVQETAEVQS